MCRQSTVEFTDSVEGVVKVMFDTVELTDCCVCGWSVVCYG